MAYQTLRNNFSSVKFTFGVSVSSIFVSRILKGPPDRRPLKEVHLFKISKSGFTIRVLLSSSFNEELLFVGDCKCYISRVVRSRQRSRHTK